MMVDRVTSESAVQARRIVMDCINQLRAKGYNTRIIHSDPQNHFWPVLTPFPAYATTPAAVEPMNQYPRIESEQSRSDSE